MGDGVDGVDTPQTVMTTRAPAVLKKYLELAVITINLDTLTC